MNKLTTRERLTQIKNKVFYNSIIMGALTSFIALSPKVAYADNASSIFKHKGGVTQKNMETGQRLGAPLWNLLGTGAGLIFSFIVAWQVFQTSIDLLYLYVPISRGFLAPNQDPQAQQGFFSSLTTISDDMQKAMELNGSNLNQNSMGAGGMQGGMGMNRGMGMNGGMGGGMGMGMGGGMGMNRGMGMGMQGGMGMSNPSMGNQPVNKKNTAITYFKNRALSLILLMICIGVLASSVLTDSGINLAELIMKVLNFFNTGLEDKLGVIIFFLH